MTGTGSTLFAIFDTQVEAENAKEAVNIDNRLILVTKKNDYSYKELADQNRRIKVLLGDGVIGNTFGFGPNVEGSSPSPPANKK